MMDAKVGEIYYEKEAFRKWDREHRLVRKGTKIHLKTNPQVIPHLSSLSSGVAPARTTDTEGPGRKGGG